MKIIRKSLDELKKPERNVRMHTDKQLHEFQRSIEMFGQIRPIVIDEEGVILAGNGLYDALRAMGRTEADCYIAAGLTEAGKKKLMLADNRVFNLGVDDMATFDSFVADLKDDLDIPGFDEDLLKSLVMDSDETSDALSEYGTVDEKHAENIKETHERYEAMNEAAAKDAEEYTPSPPEPENPSDTEEPPQPRRYILCPKCGERIWL